MSQPPSSSGWPDPAPPPAWPDPADQPAAQAASQPTSPPPPAQPAATWPDPAGQPAATWPDPAGQPTPSWPDPAAPAAVPPGAPPQPVYPGAAYGAPGAAYGTPGAAPPGYGYPYPYPQQPKTNGMAVASMVVSIVAAAGLACYGLGGLLGVVGAVLGHVARRQIQERGEGGDGMALAGVIIGWIALGIGLLIIAVFVGLLVWTWNMETTV